MVAQTGLYIFQLVWFKLISTFYVWNQFESLYNTMCFDLASVWPSLHTFMVCMYLHYTFNFIKLSSNPQYTFLCSSLDRLDLWRQHGVIQVWTQIACTCLLHSWQKLQVELWQMSHLTVAISHHNNLDLLRIYGCATSHLVSFQPVDALLL